MSTPTTSPTFPTDHQAPAGALDVARPAVPPIAGATRSAAEAARTILAGSTMGTLSTLSDDGHPWGSLVAYATLGDGRPVLLVSTLAEHGRNLVRDPRASLVAAEPAPAHDPLDGGRVTLAGRAVPPAGNDLDAARTAFLSAVPSARYYVDFGDFSLYVLDVERVRWVGGYGRMDSASAADYAAAEPDPVAGAAAGAVAHLNDDHAGALLEMAQGLGGFTQATSARCQRADRYGLDLWVRTPDGGGPCRVPFDAPCTAAGGLRAASVAALRRARARLAVEG